LLVILDGTDGAGKTTLAEAISDRVGGATIVHRSSKYTTPHMLIEYSAPLADYEPGAGRHMVLDRWHLSERVYGDLHRGGCRLSPVHWAAVDSLLDSLGAVVVIAHAPVPTLAARALARGEAPQIKDLTREAELFKQSSQFTKLNVCWADTSAHSAEVLAEAVVAIAEKREKYAAA
jgi:broad-specificity NMP kinase